mmetsp:Transcript_13161/g.29254  ORF Transcript_13161/g.29254 Transcript_13161/m.29254 type:complete len:168 (+) Transcript_13161:78-581(+)
MRVAVCIAVAAATFLRQQDPVVDPGHPCVGIMQDAKQACKKFPHTKSGWACNYAVCHYADIQDTRCADLVTTNKGAIQVTFTDDLQKLKDDHNVDCADLREAANDCNEDESAVVTAYDEKMQQAQDDGKAEGEAAAGEGGEAALTQVEEKLQKHCKKVKKAARKAHK